MSVYCRIAYPPLFLRALHAVSISRDGWAAVVFTDAGVVLHVEGTDGNMTATCTLPKGLFAEYAVIEARFALHLPTLMEAFLLLGPAIASPFIRAVLAYQAEDASVLVELAQTDDGDGDIAGRAEGCTRTLQSRLHTTNVKEHLLDLRFTDVAVVAQVTILGATLRDFIADLAAAQCVEVAIDIDPKHGVVLRGEGGPFGQVRMQVDPASDTLFSLSHERPASTRVSVHHLASACGTRSAVAGGGGGGGVAAGSRGRPFAGPFGGSVGGGSDAVLLGLAGTAVAGGATAGISAFFKGFDRLTLQINEYRQLSVKHVQRDHDAKVTVTVVVMPLSSFLDLN